MDTIQSIIIQNLLTARSELSNALLLSADQDKAVYQDLVVAMVNVNMALRRLGWIDASG